MGCHGFSFRVILAREQLLEERNGRSGVVAADFAPRFYHAVTGSACGAAVLGC